MCYVFQFPLVFPKIFVRLPKIFESVRKSSEVIGNLQNSSEGLGRLSEVFQNVRMIFVDLLKSPGDLRRCSKNIQLPSAIFGRLQVNFVQLRNNSDYR